MNEQQIRNSIEQSIISVSRILSGDYGINVVFVAPTEGAKTDGKTIMIPAIPKDAPIELIEATRGYIDHEAGHIIGNSSTQLAGTFKKVNGEQWFPIFNALEDIRVDKIMESKFTGTKLNIMKSAALAARACKGDVSEFPFITQFSLAILFKKKVGKYPKTDEMTEELLKKYGDKASDMAENARSCHDVYHIASDLVRALKQATSRKLTGQKNEADLCDKMKSAIDKATACNGKKALDKMEQLAKEKGLKDIEEEIEEARREIEEREERQKDLEEEEEDFEGEEGFEEEEEEDFDEDGEFEETDEIIERSMRQTSEEKKRIYREYKEANQKAEMEALDKQLEAIEEDAKRVRKGGYGSSEEQRAFVKALKGSKKPSFGLKNTSLTDFAMQEIKRLNKEAIEGAPSQADPEARALQSLKEMRLMPLIEPAMCRVHEGRARAMHKRIYDEFNKKLGNQIVRLLEGRKLAWIKKNQDGGRLDPLRLTQAATGRTDVFKTQMETQELTAAVGILVDVSGSTGLDIAYPGEEEKIDLSVLFGITAAMLKRAIQPYARCMVWPYSCPDMARYASGTSLTSFFMKRGAKKDMFGVVDKCQNYQLPVLNLSGPDENVGSLDKYILSAMGDTDTPESMLYMGRYMNTLMKERRKAIIVITDGCIPAYTFEVASVLSKIGIYTAFVYSNPSVHKTGKRGLVWNATPEDMPRACVEAFRLLDGCFKMPSKREEYAKDLAHYHGVRQAQRLAS